MYRVSHFITLFALALLTGALIALLWANLAPLSYQDFVELRLIDGAPIGYPNPDALTGGGRTLTLQYLVNAVLMAFFFLLAGKEIWEAAIQPQGSLRGLRAVVPLGATLGGMLVPMLVYLALAATTRSAEYAELKYGWAIPAATDLVLAYGLGRLVFGAGHQALRLLMLLAVCDNIVALTILGLRFPVGDLYPEWLLVSLAAALTVYLLFNWLPRRLDRGDQLRATSTWVRRRLSVWPYAVAGVISWLSFQASGLHPALGLLPIIPAIPHADRAFGLFAEAEEYLSDILNRIAHLLSAPVAVALFLYGLVNGGAVFAAFDSVTWVSFFALVLGKPLGITLGALLTAKVAGVALPKGITRRDLLLIGGIAGIGFTVPLMITAAALPGGAVQEAAKLGVVLTLCIAPVALIVARSLRIGRWARR